MAEVPKLVCTALICLLIIAIIVMIILILAAPQLFFKDADTKPAGPVQADKILPDQTYFISVPASGTSPAARPCQTSGGAKCLPGLYAEFTPTMQSRVYGSPYIAVRFVRQEAQGTTPTRQQRSEPIRPGEPVAIFFVQQGLWFTGTKLLLSPNQSDAVYQPFVRIDPSTVPGYTGPTDQYLLTSDLLYFGADAVNKPTHVALTGAGYPVRIGPYLPAAAEPQANPQPSQPSQ